MLPAFLYSFIAESIYLLEVALLAGPDRLRLLPPPLTVAMVLLAPIIAVLGATVASLISSRVRTYTSAQMLTSLALLPIMGTLVGLAFAMRSWNPWEIFGTVGALTAIDGLLIMRGAATWRREEVMAQR